MGYKHINNLYRDQTVLMFKRLYAMEKIHGTSTHVVFHYFDNLQPTSDYDSALENRYCKVGYFSGGEKHENFLKLFNSQELALKFLQLGINQKVTIYGEAYGGKQQGMSETYGKELKFVAFEVEIGERFVAVPYAKEICDKLAIEFVHYEEIEADPEIIDKLAHAPSIQAQRNGVENPKLPREGIVLRPLREFLHPDGKGRIMAKYKNELYAEREHTPKIKNSEELKVLEDARKIAEEWVVPMRLEHVLDNLRAIGIVIEEKRMNDIIKAMVEDVYREAKGEITESRDVYKAIGKRTAKLFIQKLKDEIK
jgi:hypothetical protein